MISHSASHVVAEDFAYLQGIIDRNYIGAGPLCAELKARLSVRFERNQVTLKELTQMQPLQHGLAEVVAYLQLADETFSAATDEATMD